MRKRINFLKVLSLLMIFSGVGFLIAYLWISLEPKYVPDESDLVGIVLEQPTFELTPAENNKPDPETDLPKVVLSGRGGQAELDKCTGSFIEITSYSRVEGLQPTYAAHNGCGGDVILKLKPGDVLLVGDKKYFVSEQKNLFKYKAKVSELLGMSGDLILQSCYWNSDYMTFLGLLPAKA